jgi:hypothetical protein
MFVAAAAARAGSKIGISEGNYRRCLLHRCASVQEVIRFLDSSVIIAQKF